MEKTAYIARDKGGNLCIYTGGKPYKCVSFWAVVEPGSSAKISNNLFPEVKWEDEEPTEVTIEIVGKKQAQQPREKQQPQTKFDPKTLQPFDKVLVRNLISSKWRCEHFSYFNNCDPKPYMTSTSYTFCIPYNEDTKHLVGATQEAPKYYRYWEG